MKKKDCANDCNYIDRSPIDCKECLERQLDAALEENEKLKKEKEQK